MATLTETVHDWFIYTVVAIFFVLPVLGALAIGFWFFLVAMFGSDSGCPRALC
jgi:hypothetical protein